MIKNTLIYICAKAASILRQPLLWFMFLIICSFINVRAFITISPPTIDSVINLENPDLKLLQNALLKRINIFRAKSKLGNLTWSEALFKSSQFHLDNMKSKKFFDHNNPKDKNYPDLQKRVMKFSDQYPCLSENLIQYFPFNFNGKVIEYNIKKVKTSYQYLDPKTLKPLNILTYSQLADQIANNWESSPPHRQNMLNDKYTVVGIAFGFPRYFKTPEVLPITGVCNFGGCN